MKLLHTADLHLGKTLHETSLLDVQEKMLESLLDILMQQSYAALLIAGDVYDRAIPSAEAVSLFSRFLAQIRAACPETAVLIIPGNHDSAQRLAFAHEILQNQRIYIAQDTSRLAQPVIITQGAEQLAVFQLPFLSFGSFSADIQEQYGCTGDSQADMAAIAARILKQTVPQDMPSLLTAHLFTIGGQNSASERSFIGTAEYINPALFSFFDYVALGHLHRCQRITDTMYYSGSPLPYSFDESDDEKCVLAVEIDCSVSANGNGVPRYPVTVERIPLTSKRPLKRLEGSFAEFFTGQKFDEWNNCFLEITLTDSEVIAHPMQLLRQKFPFLLSIRQKSFMDTVQNTAEQPQTVRTNEADDPQTLTDNFTRFETVINGEPNQIKQELFALLCKETAHET